jgi:hypothetical protein
MDGRGVPGDPARGLSQTQRRILCRVLADYIDLEHHLGDWGKDRLTVWGVPWYPSRQYHEWTATDRAVVSRAVRRLVQRGLLERANEHSTNRDAGPPRRATNLWLTPTGRTVAERLTKNMSEDVSRSHVGPSEGAES